jgi:hypothetical protein
MPEYKMKFDSAFKDHDMRFAKCFLEQQRIYIMNPDGSNLEPLTPPDDHQ